MAEKPFKVYVIQGRSPRDFSDCQAALAGVPAYLEALPFTRQEDEIIERAGDADALIVSSSPMTRRVMSALKQLKVVVRTGVGYDVIDVPAATDLGIVAVNIPDI
jgi:phosphoglycerate dehydrogenase-like enzyme